MAISEIAKRVRKRRKALGLRQEDLAAMAGVDINTIGYLETGRNQSPTVATLCRIAKALNCKSADLIGDES